jgi:hypothetical protein
MTLRGLAREPLVHFLLLGALLFVLYGWLNRQGFAAPDEILVSQQQIAGLVMQFERVWQRTPTATERQALIDSWVRDEVYYREALAMGLERDDPVVRRRMSQKIQFILDSGDPAAPTDAELQQWLDDHADKYRLEPAYALQQIYFDPARRGETTGSDVAAALRALEGGRAVTGDSTMLPARLDGSATEVARAFGTEFESALRTVPVGSWQGPVESGFGLHLVRLEKREDGRVAQLADVRGAVERDLLHAKAQAANDAYYENLRSKYAVRVEDELQPAPGG